MFVLPFMVNKDVYKNNLKITKFIISNIVWNQVSEDHSSVINTPTLKKHLKTYFLNAVLEIQL